MLETLSEIDKHFWQTKEKKKTQLKNEEFFLFTFLLLIRAKYGYIFIPKQKKKTDSRHHHPLLCHKRCYSTKKRHKDSPLIDQRTHHQQKRTHNMSSSHHNNNKRGPATTTLSLADFSRGHNAAAAEDDFSWAIDRPSHQAHHQKTTDSTSAVATPAADEDGEHRRGCFRRERAQQAHAPSARVFNFRDGGGQSALTVSAASATPIPTAPPFILFLKNLPSSAVDSSEGSQTAEALCAQMGRQLSVTPLRARIIVKGISAMAFVEVRSESDMRLLLSMRNFSFGNRLLPVDVANESQRAGADRLFDPTIIAADRSQQLPLRRTGSGSNASRNEKTEDTTAAAENHNSLAGAFAKATGVGRSTSASAEAPGTATKAWRGSSSSGGGGGATKAVRFASSAPSDASVGGVVEPPSSSSQPFRVYAGNLPSGTTAAAVRALFEATGITVTAIANVRTSGGGAPPSITPADANTSANTSGSGYTFMDVADEDQLSHVLAQNGTRMGGAEMVITRPKGTSASTPAPTTGTNRNAANANATAEQLGLFRTASDFSATSASDRGGGGGKGPSSRFPSSSSAAAAARRKTSFAADSILFAGDDIVEFDDGDHSSSSSSNSPSSHASAHCLSTASMRGADPSLVSPPPTMLSSSNDQQLTTAAASAEAQQQPKQPSPTAVPLSSSALAQRHNLGSYTAASYSFGPAAVAMAHNADADADEACEDDDCEDNRYYYASRRLSRLRQPSHQHQMWGPQGSAVSFGGSEYESAKSVGVASEVDGEGHHFCGDETNTLASQSVRGNASNTNKSTAANTYVGDFDDLCRYADIEDDEDEQSANENGEETMAKGGARGSAASRDADACCCAESTTNGGNGGSPQQQQPPAIAGSCRRCGRHCRPYRHLQQPAVSFAIDAVGSGPSSASAVLTSPLRGPHRSGSSSSRRGAFAPHHQPRSGSSNQGGGGGGSRRQSPFVRSLTNNSAAGFGFPSSNVATAAASTVGDDDEASLLDFSTSSEAVSHARSLHSQPAAVSAVSSLAVSRGNGEASAAPVATDSQRRVEFSIPPPAASATTTTTESLPNPNGYSRLEQRWRQTSPPSLAGSQRQQQQHLSFSRGDEEEATISVIRTDDRSHSQPTHNNNISGHYHSSNNTSYGCTPPSRLAVFSCDEESAEGGRVRPTISYSVGGLSTNGIGTPQLNGAPQPSQATAQLDHHHMAGDGADRWNGDGGGDDERGSGGENGSDGTYAYHDRQISRDIFGEDDEGEFNAVNGDSKNKRGNRDNENASEGYLINASPQPPCPIAETAASSPVSPQPTVPPATAAPSNVKPPARRASHQPYASVTAALGGKKVEEAERPLLSSTTTTMAHIGAVGVGGDPDWAGVLAKKATALVGCGVKSPSPASLKGGSTPHRSPHLTASGAVRHCAYIGNLPTGTCVSDVEAFFRTTPLLSLQKQQITPLIIRMRTNAKCTFAFVDVPSEAALRQCVAASGALFNGRPARIVPAKHAFQQGGGSPLSTSNVGIRGTPPLSPAADTSGSGNGTPLVGARKKQQQLAAAIGTPPLAVVANAVGGDGGASYAISSTSSSAHVTPMSLPSPATGHHHYGGAPSHTEDKGAAASSISGAAAFPSQPAVVVPPPPPAAALRPSTTASAIVHRATLSYSYSAASASVSPSPSFKSPKASAPPTPHLTAATTATAAPPIHRTPQLQPPPPPPGARIARSRSESIRSTISAVSAAPAPAPTRTYSFGAASAEDHHRQTADETPPATCTRNETAAAALLPARRHVNNFGPRNVPPPPPIAGEGAASSAPTASAAKPSPQLSPQAAPFIPAPALVVGEGEGPTSAPSLAENQQETNANDDEKKQQPSSAGATTVRHCVYVGNLPTGTTVEEVRHYFSAEVGVTALVVRIRSNEKSTFAFVDVPSAEVLRRCVALSGEASFGGRTLRMKRSQNVL